MGQSFKCLVHLVIQNSVLKKVKEFYNKKRPSKGWSGVHLLHDNASSHLCEVVKSFLASEKLKVLNHPPDLSPCDFFLFPRLKKMLSGNKYTSRRWSGGAKVSCISRHWGVQLILAYSWARPAILVAGKGRGGMFLFLPFLHFHSRSSFFPVPLFRLFYCLFYLFFSFSLGDDTK